MATESIDPANPPNEFPDIVGAKPDNPWLARFTPYIPARTIMRELTPRALIVGTLLGMVFGASSLYLVLKVGLTVSASIPVAVISITLFRLFSKMGAKNATILENNIVQTAGSAGESIALDRKSTRLNSSHSQISYAVFCLKKKKKKNKKIK